MKSIFTFRQFQNLRSVSLSKHSKWADYLFRPFKILFFTFLFFISSNSFAQTFPSASSCTSKDLSLVSAMLDVAKCEACTLGDSVYHNLTVGINNKTGSTRTSFAFWATLTILNSDGTTASTTPIQGCFSTIPKTATTYFVYPTKLGYKCGQTLELTNIWEAWTDASPGATCPVLLANTSTINPKCGTNPLLNILAGDDANPTVTDATCTSKGSILVKPIGGTAPYTVKLYDSTGTLIATSTSIPAAGSYTFSNLVGNATYTLKTTDANNCPPVVQTRKVLLINNLSAPTVTTVQPLCSTSNGTITVTSPTGTGYTYSKGGTNYQSSATFSVGAGSYKITFKNSTGCISPDTTVTITAPPAISLSSAGVTTAITCNGGTATVTIAATGGTAPISYTFNGQTNTTGVFTGVSAGTGLAYSITDANKCGPVTGTINVTQPTAISFSSASVTSPIVCNGGTATVTIAATGGTAPISYTFNGQTNTTGVFTGVSAGTGLAYIITDANKCGPVTGTINVTQPPAISLSSAGVTTPIACNGGTATVTIAATGGTGTISYTFNGQTNTTGVFTGVSAGTNLAYSITDANKCGPVTGTINVTQPDVLAAPTICVVQPSLCTSTGSISVLSPTGTGYQYSIAGSDKWQYETTFSGLLAGSSPSVIVQSPQGCISSAASSCDASNCVLPLTTQTTATTDPTQPSKIAADQTTVKAYPNPFNNEVKFVVNAAHAGNGTLEIFNVLGQKVKTVYHGYVPAGVNNFDLNLPGQKNANLIYRFILDNKLVTGKLIQLNQ